MFPNQKIISLVASLKKNDTIKADKILQELIEISEARGTYNVSEKLRRLYSQPYENNQTNGDTVRQSSVTPDPPVDDLFELRKSKVTRSDIVLSEENTTVLDDLIFAYKNKAKLKKHNIPIDSRVLLYGPPGTGKTLFAYVLAYELGIPIMHINIDRVISSYLGETGKNISSIFEKAKSGGYLVLLDEFDAIAKKRDDDLELGELKRVVTVLLQNLDNLDPSTVLVAATNHEHLLDNAIKRRFAYEINLTYLDEEARRKLLSRFLADTPMDIEVDIDTLSKLSKGLSGAHIKLAVNRSLRKWILENRRIDINELLVDELIRGKYGVNGFDSKDKQDVSGLVEIVRLTRAISPTKYTYKYLERLSKISDSTIHHLTQKESQ